MKNNFMMWIGVILFNCLLFCTVFLFVTRKAGIYPNKIYYSQKSILYTAVLIRFQNNDELLLDDLKRFQQEYNFTYEDSNFNYVIKKLLK